MMNYGARPGSIKAAMQSLQGVASCDAADARRARRASVLLLQDDVDLLTILTRMLMASGYFVTTSQLGGHAMGALNSEQPVDLVIADLVLPGMDGVEFCNRAALVRPGLPFIIMTGSDSVIDLGRFPPNTDTMPKPFRRSDVLALVSAKLDPAPRLLS